MTTWTVPDTARATGQLISATIWNTEVAGNLVHLQTHHGARVYHTSTVSIATAAVTGIFWNSERYDSDGFHDTTTNTNRLTVPTGLSGRFLVGVGVEWAANAAGIRQVRLILNGTSLIGIVSQNNQGASLNVYQQCQTVYPLVPTDYVTVSVYQDSGGTLGVTHTTPYGEFYIAWLGA